jgi:hypothetical protein
MVAELIEKGISLKEIAGLDDMQIMRVYFRERDEHGRLIRHGKGTKRFKDSTPGSWRDMIYTIRKAQVKRLAEQGMDVSKYDDTWLANEWRNYVLEQSKENTYGRSMRQWVVDPYNLRS